jgi:hypothetical protein
MIGGFEEDEGFWEVGFHLFLVLLTAMPLIFLTDYLATIAKVRDHAPIAFGLLIGIALGDAVVGSLRRRFRRTSAAGQPSSTEV